MNPKKVPTNYKTKLDMFSDQIKKAITDEFEKKAHITIFNMKAEIRELEQTIREYNSMASIYDEKLGFKCDNTVPECKCDICRSRLEHQETFNFAIKQRDICINEYKEKLAEFRKLYFLE